MSPAELERLQRALTSRGYQPARDDLASLWTILARGDREAAETASRALARLGEEAAPLAWARLDGATPSERARLVRLLGRVTRQAGPWADRLVTLVADPDDRTARNAALALGRLGASAPTSAEAALLARWPPATPVLQRALVEALGKIGGASALGFLSTVQSADLELARLVAEARLKLERTAARADAGEILEHRVSPRPLLVHAHCRAGLAQLCAEELAAFSPRLLDEATVAVTLQGPLSALWRSRTLLRFGLPLPSLRGTALEEAVIEALSDETTWELLAHFTAGPVRYRLEWADAGHRRALTFRVAAAVAARRPALRNDPTATLWEVIVPRGQGAIELWPRGLADPRFTYRRALVPAASHPTIAAALARVSGARDEDIVWDPFAGAGTELIERARLGPARALFGSDADPAALARAGENLAAAGVVATLLAGDARHFRPPLRPTVILTNPPLGRRVLDRHQIGQLYHAFLTHAAALLPSGGRLVWISPRPQETLRRAHAVGLHSTLRQRVDMSGFWAELQCFVRS